MALIERITFPLLETGGETPAVFPGLRITIRSTTSSLSDYPEWNPEELSLRSEDNLVTDGSCS